MMDVHVVPTALAIEYFEGTLTATEANTVNPMHARH